VPIAMRLRARLNALQTVRRHGFYFAFATGLISQVIEIRSARKCITVAYSGVQNVLQLKLKPSVESTAVA
jgi:hypothetical protein